VAVITVGALSSVGSVTAVPALPQVPMTRATGVTRMSTVPSAVAVSEPTAYALERHGHEAGGSQEQQECVEVHVSIEAVVGR
jgi:hypothetical protein